jgi:hypothetical protein
MTINVTENDDYSFEITWDPDDPVEWVLNTWTEDDFINAIMKECNKVIEENEIECRKRLEMVADKLGGKLEHYVCSDLHNEHQKYVITYNHKKRNDSL